MQVEKKSYFETKHGVHYEVKEVDARDESAIAKSLSQERSIPLYFITFDVQSVEHEDIVYKSDRLNVSPRCYLGIDADNVRTIAQYIDYMNQDSLENPSMKDANDHHIKKIKAAYSEDTFVIPDKEMFGEFTVLREGEKAFNRAGQQVFPVALPSKKPSLAIKFKP